ncbi:TRAP transporter small permease [Pseudoprimorskyibacter insulae]|uniref:TRAP transporter small permease protein n=1 Tax=Pseudoprimorskyibacter insulae TaxID=1695997 RepID=A0A2R8AWG7_9RHOB|nr:TRAP transporter small permease [Pseudoprimorskyibacter insulae]SPF80257.1 Sialic acid TRAP transporter small permease protein SiaQ [Pseudoprimorskyibacter insulae]
MATELSLIDRALNAIASVAMGLSSVLMVVLIVIFGWLVFGRYVLNDTPTWVEQLALLIVVWIAFLAAAVGIRRNSHLAVDFIRDAMPGPLRRACVLLSIAALLFFGVVMAWQGYVMFERTAQREIPLLGVSEGWRAVPVALSGAMIALFCLDELIKTLLAGDRS